MSTDLTCAVFLSVHVRWGSGGIRLTLKLLLDILVLEFGALVRHDGGDAESNDVPELISVFDKYAVRGLRVMCCLASRLAVCLGN